MYKELASFLKLIILNTASAGSVDISGGGTKLTNPLGCETIPCVGQRIVRGLFSIATPIVVIMVLVGAFQLLTAGGNPERISKGRKTILYAVVGYAIVLVAQGLAFIIEEILSG